MFKPQILLGLTATPERADGKSLLPDFNNRIAAEMRLPEAINRLLLSPFQYFCIGDKTVDLSRVKWSAAAGSYDEDELFRQLNTEGRLNLILSTIPRYLSDEHRCHALCFCCRKEHAETTAQDCVRPATWQKHLPAMIRKMSARRKFSDSEMVK